MIKINDQYAIGNTAQNITIMKSHTNGKTGEVSWSHQQYYTSYEALYDGLLKLKVVETVDLGSLKEAVDQIKKFSDEAVKAIIIAKCL